MKTGLAAAETGGLHGHGVGLQSTENWKEDACGCGGAL